MGAGNGSVSIPIASIVTKAPRTHFPRAPSTPSTGMFRPCVRYAITNPREPSERAFDLASNPFDPRAHGRVFALGRHHLHEGLDVRDPQERKRQAGCAGSVVFASEMKTGEPLAVEVPDLRHAKRCVNRALWDRHVPYIDL